MKKKLAKTQYLLPEKLKRDSTVPLYSQIHAQLRREIVLGDFRPGEKFYSYRELKRLYGVELRTVAASLNLLVRDGLVEKQAARGTYVRRTDLCREVGNIWFAVIGHEGYHPFYFNVLNGLICEAQKFGLRVMVKLSGGRRDFLEWFEPSPGEGLILTGEIDNAFVRCAGKKCNNNVVVIGNYENIENAGTVCARFSAALETALGLAWHKGARHFMLITGDITRPISRGLREKVGAFCETKKCGFVPISAPGEDGYAALADAAALPDCIVVTEAAYKGVLCRMLEQRLRCPDDIFLIRYGRERQDRSSPDYAAVDMEGDGRKFGAAALRLLLRGGKETTALDIVCRIKRDQEKSWPV